MLLEILLYICAHNLFKQEVVLKYNRENTDNGESIYLFNRWYL